MQSELRFCQNALLYLFTLYVPQTTPEQIFEKIESFLLLWRVWNFFQTIPTKFPGVTFLEYAVVEVKILQILGESLDPFWRNDHSVEVSHVNDSNFSLGRLS